MTSSDMAVKPKPNLPIAKSTIARLQAVALWLIVALLALYGCKRNEPKPKAVSQEDKLIVFAAASLRGAFTAIGNEFKQIHPNARIDLNFAGTQELRTQLEQGADVDVFASADQRHMGELVKSNRVASPSVFARNEPVLAVSKESSAKVKAISDLPSAGRVIVGVPEVPIGRYTIQILERASKTLGSDFRSRVEARVISRELNVRQIFSKVSLGEADVGIVYRSDVQGDSTGVTLVTIPSDINVIAEYPIAVVSNAKHPKLAQAWVALVLSANGQRILARFGFIFPATVASSP